MSLLLTKILSVGDFNQKQSFQSKSQFKPLIDKQS
jgi:hypothetical protein